MVIYVTDNNHNKNIYFRVLINKV